MDQIRKDPQAIVWIVESLIQLLNARRKTIVVEQKLNLSHSLLRDQPKPAQKRARGDADNSARNSNHPPKRPKPNTTAYEPTAEPSEGDREAILGDYTNGLGLKLAPDKHGLDMNTLLIQFVNELMACRGLVLTGKENPTEKVQARTVQIRGATDAYQCMARLFSKTGLRRILSLAVESSNKRSTIGMACIRIELQAKRLDCPSQVAKLAKAWQGYTTMEMAREDQGTVTYQYKEAKALHQLGLRISDLKIAMKSKNPTPDIAKFTSELRNKFGTSVGVGMATLLLKWLISTAGVTDSRAATRRMRDTLSKAHILMDLHTVFGDGILLFVDNSVYTNFRNLPKSTIPAVLQKFNEYWLVKETCDRVWDKFGQQLVEQGTTPDLVIPKKPPPESFDQAFGGISRSQE